MPEVSLERGKFPLQDYIHNSKIFFLHRKSGFRIAGHICIDMYIYVLPNLRICSFYRMRCAI